MLGKDLVVVICCTAVAILGAVAFGVGCDTRTEGTARDATVGEVAPDHAGLHDAGHDAPDGDGQQTTPAICSEDGWCWSNPLPQGNPLDAIWGSGPSDVWAVGHNGTILRWDGSAWTGVCSGGTQHLQAIWGSGPSDVWAVGSRGTILRWDGTTWRGVSSGTTNWLVAVWGSGPDDIWAGG